MAHKYRTSTTCATGSFTLTLVLAVAASSLALAQNAGGHAGPADTSVSEGLYAAEIDPTSVERFAGVVGANPIYVAFDVVEYAGGEEPHSVTAYLCDGEELAIWFTGQFRENHVTRVGDGATIEISVSLGNSYGVVTLDNGEEHLFTAPVAPDGAGLYRAEETIDGVDYVGGWIGLPDGSQRGALTVGGEVIENPTADFAAQQVETSVGTMPLCRCWIGCENSCPWCQGL